MTIFVRDKKEVLNGNSTVVLKERKAELEKLYREGRGCKNSFRRECIAQEYTKLQSEYNELDQLI